MIPPFLARVISLVRQGLSSGERIAHLSYRGNSWLHLLIEKFNQALKPTSDAWLLEVSTGQDIHS